MNAPISPPQKHFLVMEYRPIHTGALDSVSGLYLLWMITDSLPIPITRGLISYLQRDEPGGRFKHPLELC